jgi:hypothetical protein
VAGAQVGEPGRRILEEVPDDDEDGPGDGALGDAGAAFAGDAAVPFAEEGGGALGAVGGLGAQAAQVGVALAFLA